MTNCIDCGVETKPGPGSARCKSCWEDRCGGHPQFELMADGNYDIVEIREFENE